MRDFSFHQPETLEQAAQLFEGSDDGRFMAGGQTLIPVMKQGLSAPEDIIDLGRIEQLNGITVGGTTLSVGAMTTHAAVAASAQVRDAIPALAALAGVTLPADGLNSDIHASAEYRAHLIGVLAKRAVAAVG